MVRAGCGCDEWQRRGRRGRWRRGVEGGARGCGRESGWKCDPPASPSAAPSSRSERDERCEDDPIRSRAAAIRHQPGVALTVARAARAKKKKETDAASQTNAETDDSVKPSLRKAEGDKNMQSMIGCTWEHRGSDVERFSEKKVLRPRLEKNFARSWLAFSRFSFAPFAGSAKNCIQAAFDRCMNR